MTNLKQPREELCKREGGREVITTSTDSSPPSYEWDFWRGVLGFLQWFSKPFMNSEVGCERKREELFWLLMSL